MSICGAARLQLPSLAANGLPSRARHRRLEAEPVVRRAFSLYVGRNGTRHRSFTNPPSDPPRLPRFSMVHHGPLLGNTPCPVHARETQLLLHALVMPPVWVATMHVSRHPPEMSRSQQRQPPMSRSLSVMSRGVEAPWDVEASPPHSTGNVKSRGFPRDLRGLGLAAAPHGRFVLSCLSRLEIISRRLGRADVLISTG